MVLIQIQPYKQNNRIINDAMLEKYHKLQPKPKTTDELKVTLQTNWEEVPQVYVN